MQLRGLLGDERVELALACLETRLLGLEHLDLLGRRRDLVEAREGERVEPGRPRRAVSLVHRPGGSVLAGDRILRVQAPEPAVLADPRRRLVDHVRRPLVRLPRPDREPVAAREVDERDPQRVA
jgi:hypothetical protein